MKPNACLYVTFVGLRALLTFSRIKLIYLSHHLEVQHVTAEKQSPSALDYFAAISAALGLERRMAKPGQSKALKDLLTTVVGNYNKNVFNEVAPNQQQHQSNAI